MGEKWFIVSEGVEVAIEGEKEVCWLGTKVLVFVGKLSISSNKGSMWTSLELLETLWNMIRNI